MIKMHVSEICLSLLQQTKDEITSMWVSGKPLIKK